MARNKKTVLILLTLSFVAILIRGLLSTVVNRGDVLVQLEWAKVIYQQKLPNSYFYPIWTYSPPTQPPLMMLGFWFSQHIYENRYLLSEMHNFIRIPPASLILWFDKFGEVVSIRLWEILGDIAAAFIVFKLVSDYCKKRWLAILAFAIVAFNPITLFETSIWGQNDLFSAVFVYLSFFMINSSPLSFIVSPLFFILGLLSKPVGLLLLPVYIFYYLFRLVKIKSNNFTKITSPLISILVSCALVGLLFLPFIVDKSKLVSETSNIIFNRIAPQSKGVSRGSNSAFNFYSLFFQIDVTSGSEKILGLSLDHLGILIFLILNFISFFIILRYWPSSKKNQLFIISFIIFFISQGSFLFMTGMLERYFFLGIYCGYFINVFLIFQTWMSLIFQQIIWFINLLYAFYLRDIGFIKPFFWNNNYLITRILSLLALVNFFIIIYKSRYILPPKIKVNSV